MLPISDRFERAVVHGVRLHAHQARKGAAEEPYVAHLFAVAALVMEHGGDEDEAIAGLLHDAVEDQGGAPRLAEIREAFGARVAAIVEGCSDAIDAPAASWRARKEAHVAHLRDHADASTRLVVACDKLHNARSLLREHAREGESIWARFRGGRDGTLWYYRAMDAVFLELGPAVVGRELAAVIRSLETGATDPDAPPPPQAPW